MKNRPRQPAPNPPGRPGFGLREALPVVGLLLLTTVLAVTSLLGDSITYDETSHLTSGMSYLRTGDFRLAPDHPPLAKVWAAAPLLMLHTTWLPPDDPGWLKADPFLAGRAWLFRLNAGERLLPAARLMIVVLLLILDLSIYFLARRLFGPGAGLLALLLAALSPSLLAHGRLVTTDLPITLAVTVSIWAFARLLERVTPGRFLAAAAALGAASVTKLSWPLVLPSLGCMGLWAVVRGRPGHEVRPRRRGKNETAPKTWAANTRARELLLVLLLALALATTTWASIWTAYGWRAGMFADADDPAQRPAVEAVASAWNRILYQPDGRPQPGLLPAMLRWSAEHHLLPDAYLFGLAWTLEATSGREAYFCGETGRGGWFWYFPVAFLIKTPVPTLLLILAGSVAVLGRRTAVRDGVLLTGLLAYAGVHGLYLLGSHFNIGHRHLLPIYPALFVLAGGASTWWASRPGRWGLAAAVLWLAGVNAWIHPHYLAYFNELVGGPARGHHYLADSNIDWGQDLKRLARYARLHPDETIKLSYFGSADPTCYGFDCVLLPSSLETGSAAALAGGGTYVISVTHLLGVYDRYAQDAFWRRPGAVQEYRTLNELMEHPEAVPPDRLGQLRERWHRLRWGRFLYRLRRRPPTERIGYSLFVYRLTAEAVETLSAP